MRCGEDSEGIAREKREGVLGFMMVSEEHKLLSAVG